MSATALASALASLAPAGGEDLWLHSADTLACLAAAQATVEGAALRGFFGQDSLDARLAGQAAAIRFSEADAIEIPSCLTPAAIAVPVALALSPDAESYARAVNAGYAIGSALAQGIGGAAALGVGVWPTLLAAPAIAAVTAAVATQAGAEEIAHALTLSLAGVSGRAGRPGGMPSGRWIVIGEATLKGLRAARAARQGATGDLGLLSADWLASQSSATLARPDALESLTMDAVARTGLKPIVAARQGCTALAALRGAIEDGRVLPAEIQGIDVSLPPVTLGVVSRPVDPQDRLSRVASLPLALGLAVWSPEALYDLSRDTPTPPKASALAGKITLTGDPALSGVAPGEWPCRLRVQTVQGWEDITLTRMPGDPGTQDRAGLVRRKIAGFRLGPEAEELGELATVQQAERGFDLARRVAQDLAAGGTRVAATID